MGFPGYRIFKSHSALNHNFKNVVYVVRNPLDVMTSYYNFCVSLGLLSGGFEAFVMSKQYGISAWTNHVRPWLYESRAEIGFHLVKYEDLHADPVRTLAKLFEFFGNFVSSEILEQAVKNSSFENSKNEEINSAYGGRPSFKNFSFFRSGRVGEGKLLWTPELVTIAKESAGDLLNFLGYSF